MPLIDAITTLTADSHWPLADYWLATPAASQADQLLFIMSFHAFIAATAAYLVFESHASRWYV
jgi:hypothetical protein